MPDPQDDRPEPLHLVPPVLDYYGEDSWRTRFVRRLFGRRQPPQEERRLSPDEDLLLSRALKGDMDVSIIQGQLFVDGLTQYQSRLLERVRQAYGERDPMPRGLHNRVLETIDEGRGPSERSEDAQEPADPPVSLDSDGRPKTGYTHKATSDTPMGAICGALGVKPLVDVVMRWSNVTCPDCLTLDPRVAHAEDIERLRRVRSAPDASPNFVVHHFDSGLPGDSLGSSTSPACGDLGGTYWVSAATDWSKVTCPKCLAEPIHYWRTTAEARWLHELPEGEHRATRRADEVTCRRCLVELGQFLPTDADWKVAVTGPDGEEIPGAHDDEVFNDAPPYTEPIAARVDEDVPEGEVWLMSGEQRVGTLKVQPDGSATGYVTSPSIESVNVAYPAKSATWSAASAGETQGAWHLTTGADPALSTEERDERLSRLRPTIPGDEGLQRLPEHHQEMNRQIFKAITDAQDLQERWRLVKSVWHLVGRDSWRAACGLEPDHYEQEVVGRPWVAGGTGPLVQSWRCPVCEKVADHQTPLIQDWGERRSLMQLPEQDVSDLEQCHGNQVYWCPVTREIECPEHGGFTTCCERPRDHWSIQEVEKFLRMKSVLDEGPRRLEDGLWHCSRGCDPLGHRQGYSSKGKYRREHRCWVSA